MTCARVAYLFAGALSMGCASMPNLRHVTPAERRDTCQAYVDNSARFVGQQQGWGVVFTALAATSVTAGAALENADSGNTWDKNRKTILLTAAVPAAILAYNFLSNASSASTSAAGASLALADKDDEAMWVGCERARAAYWDGRTAGIAATSTNLNKTMGTPSTPQGGVEAASQMAADQSLAKATKAVADAKAAIDNATTKKPVPANSRDANMDAAETAFKDAQEAEERAKAATTALKGAIAVGDSTTAQTKLIDAIQAGDDAVKRQSDVQAKIREYLK
ncbi:MAG TPA: hypothetical protein VIV60_11255 [Polyangiaceae bacterium]